MGEPRDFKFGTLTYHSKSHPADEKYSSNGAWSGSGEPFAYLSRPLLVFSFQNRPASFPGQCRKRRLNLALVFLCLFCIVVRFFWLMNACFCCVRFSFYSTPSQEIGLGGTCPNWPILFRVGHKTTTQSITYRVCRRAAEVHDGSDADRSCRQRHHHSDEVWAEPAVGRPLRPGAVCPLPDKCHVRCVLRSSQLLHVHDGVRLLAVAKCRLWLVVSAKCL